MKEVVKEIVKNQTFYEASDGTLFKDKEECMKWEKSSEYAALVEVMKVPNSEINYKFVPNSFDECKYMVFVPKTEEDCFILSRCLKMFNRSDVMFKKNNRYIVMISECDGYATFGCVYCIEDMISEYHKYLSL